MTTKSEIDRMLETLESCGRDLPAHMVRQLLRMLAARCDELEATLLAAEHVLIDRCGKIEDGLASINIENRLTVMEAKLTEVVGQVAEESDREVLMTDMANETLADEVPDEPEAGPGIPKWALDACSDETKHLLASPRNAAALARSIKQAGKLATDKFYADYDARLKFIAEAVKQKRDREALRRSGPSGEDEGSFW